MDYIVLRVMPAMKDDLHRIVGVLHEVVDDCGLTLDDIELGVGLLVRLARTYDSEMHRIPFIGIQTGSDLPLCVM